MYLIFLIKALCAFKHHGRRVFQLFYISGFHVAQIALIFNLCAKKPHYGIIDYGRSAQPVYDELSKFVEENENGNSEQN
jgi:hypothetical protein